jgi:hypothetical protein
MTTAMITPEDGNALFKMAEAIARTEFVPEKMRGKVHEVFAAVLFGREVGLNPMASVQNVAVINGKPSLWGDAALAVVQNHPAYEWHQESTFEQINETGVAVIRVKRRGNPEPFVSKFSVDDAKRARLWGRKGPWTDYPQRMLQMRARGFGLRNAFADALRGLITAEEARDYDAPRPVAPPPPSDGLTFEPSAALPPAPTALAAPEVLTQEEWDAAKPEVEAQERVGLNSPPNPEPQPQAKPKVQAKPKATPKPRKARKAPPAPTGPMAQV